MFEEREVITLLLGVGVAVFIVQQIDLIRSVQHWRLLLTAFGLLFVSLACSVIEEFFLNALLNFTQHLCSALSAVSMAAWCAKTFRKAEVSR
jgi:hypothetical protein